MSGRVRTRVDRGTGELVAYSDAAVRNNLGVIEYCRTSMAALSGATAGLCACVWGNVNVLVDYNVLYGFPCVNGLHFISSLTSVRIYGILRQCYTITYTMYHCFVMWSMCLLLFIHLLSAP